MNEVATLSDIAKRELRRENRLEWLGLAALVLLFVAGLSGGFGGAPWGQVRVCAGPDAVCVEHERFARRGAQTLVRIEAGAPGEDGTLRLTLSRELLDAFELAGVQPEPLEQRGHPDELDLRFGASAGATGLPLTLTLRPVGLGARRGLIRVGSSAPLELRFFVHP